MTWHKSEEEVDAMIEDMKKRGKGKYITQGVAFNKTCPRQMALLKQALMHSASFSGLAKEVLAQKFSGQQIAPQQQSQQPIKPKTKNIGNFL